MHGFYSFWDGPGLRAGVGAADFLHVRHPIPQSRFASVGGCKPRSRPCGLLANQGGAAVFRSAGSAGSAGSGGSPAAVRVVGESGRGGVSRSAENPGRVSVCPAAGEGSRMPIRVSAGPKAEERTNAGPPSAGCLVCRDMRGSVTRTAPSVCRKGVLVVGTGALPCLLPAKNEGSPERLPSPSKINP